MAGTVLRDVLSGNFAVVSVTVHVHKPGWQSLQMQVCMLHLYTPVSAVGLFTPASPQVQAMQCADVMAMTSPGNRSFPALLQSMGPPSYMQSVAGRNAVMRHDCY